MTSIVFSVAHTHIHAPTHTNTHTHKHALYELWTELWLRGSSPWRVINHVFDLGWHWKYTHAKTPHTHPHTLTHKYVSWCTHAYTHKAKGWLGLPAWRRFNWKLWAVLDPRWSVSQQLRGVQDRKRFITRVPTHLAPLLLTPLSAKKREKTTCLLSVIGHVGTCYVTICIWHCP